MAPVLEHTALQYSVSGREDAPALLLIHAMGADRRMWNECVDDWAKDYRIVACDLRGAGQTPAPDRPWTLADHARDIEALRSALGLTRVIPVGCAVGALVAATYAAAYPQHVLGLVLSEPTLRIGEASRARIDERVALIRQGGMQALVPAAIDLAFAEQPKDSRYHEYTSRFLENDPEGYAMIAWGIIGADLTEALLAISVPVLVLAGEHDRLFPPDHARDVQARLRDAECRILPNVAHFPPFQNPPLFAQVVADFLIRRIVRAEF